MMQQVKVERLTMIYENVAILVPESYGINIREDRKSIDNFEGFPEKNLDEEFFEQSY